MIVVFEPIVHRYQVKSGEPAQWAIGSPAPTGVSKTSSRSPFESACSPLIVHPGSLERIFDHVFSQLKVHGDAVGHGVVMTEAVGNPVYCRREVCEMLFEGYGVPQASFLLDGPCSLMANKTDTSPVTALIVAIGHGATHILPVIDGMLVAGGVKRIDFGGAVAAEQLNRLLALKYPGTRLSPAQCQAALHAGCQVAQGDYRSQLEAIASDPAAYTLRLQLPFTPTDVEAEAARARDREALALKRKEQAERLRERAHLKRVARLEAKQQHLQALQDLRSQMIKASTTKKPQRKTEDDEEEGGSDVELEEEEDEDDMDEQLLNHGFRSVQDFEAALETAQREVRILEQRIAGVPLAEIETEPVQQVDYGLLDVPDAELDAARLAEKRRLRLMKSGAEARERARQAKAEAEDRQRKEKERDEQMRTDDFESWRRIMYERRSRLVNRIRARQQKREALSDRKSMASSARLRAVIGLGMDSTQAKKKGATDGAEEADDHFGTDDEDWQVYRDIKSGPIDPLTAGDDEDAQQQREEADQAALMAMEEELERYDESFFAVLAQELSASRTILDRLREPEVPAQDDESARHQLHMNVERWRVPESLFQPQALLGLDSAGLPEAINHLLSALPPSQQFRLTANIFITGGYAATPGLAARLQSELRALRPDNEQVVVKMAADLQGDAWRGAARIASDGAPWITRAWYDEHGGERLPSTAWYTNPY